jgi:hypothetical protein
MTSSNRCLVQHVSKRALQPLCYSMWIGINCIKRIVILAKELSFKIFATLLNCQRLKKRASAFKMKKRSFQALQRNEALDPVKASVEAAR